MGPIGRPARTSPTARIGQEISPEATAYASLAGGRVFTAANAAPTAIAMTAGPGRRRIGSRWVRATSASGATISPATSESLPVHQPGQAAFRTWSFARSSTRAPIATGWSNASRRDRSTPIGRMLVRPASTVKVGSEATRGPPTGSGAPDQRLDLFD
jgi:hypothetical protein